MQVEPGADLVLTATEIGGEVHVASDGYFDAEGGSVSGELTSEGYGIWLRDTQAGAVTVTEPSAEDGTTFLYAIDAELDGAIGAAAGDVYLESTRVGGDVATTGTTFTDIVDSTLLANLTITTSSSGVAVCDSEIDGTARVLENAGAVHLGTGLIDSCTGMAYVGGDLEVADNTGGVVVRDTLVRGDLTGEGNDPAPHGQDNRVRGDVGGQFTDLEPAPGTDSFARDAGPAEAGERLLERRDERRQDALEQAAAIGAAAL